MTTRCTEQGFCLSRRNFLLLAGGTIVTLSTGLESLAQVVARTKSYPRKRLSSLSDLKQSEPVYFTYPDNGPSAECMLVKLGEPAGGGIGPEKDIVAFSTTCTHMGGPLKDTYHATHQVLGPCPLHQTSFDLSRHGMVVAGHATESLPQVILATEDETIYATGFLGLLYGRHANL